MAGDCRFARRLPGGRFVALLALFTDGVTDRAGGPKRIALGYVNGASTRRLRGVLRRLDGAAEGGLAVDLTWEHEATDDAMADLGRELAEDLHFLRLMTRALVVRAA